MRLRSRMTAIATSAAAMALSGMLVVGAAELVTTTKNIENSKSIEEADTTDILMNDIAEVSHADKDIVRAVEPETETKSESETVEEETTSSYTGKFMVNIDEYLNIRAASDENAEVVGKLYAGAGGTVIEKGAEWTKISSGSVEGYAATQYLLFDGDAEAKAKEVGKLQVTILEDSIRVRKLPSTEAGVWGLVEKDAVYTTTNAADGWAEINYDGETGYVSTDYARVELVIGQAISTAEEQEQIRLAEERKAAAAEKARKKEAAAKAEEQKIATESKFVETVKTSAYNVSEEDVYLLASLVCAEAGYEPYEGKLAVANVVLNRLNGGSYGSTMSSVIYASGQFSVAASGRLASVMASGPNAESIAAAKDALAGNNNVPNYPNFRSCGVANYSDYNNYSIIGNQVFFN